MSSRFGRYQMNKKYACLMDDESTHSEDAEESGSEDEMPPLTGGEAHRCEHVPKLEERGRGRKFIVHGHTGELRRPMKKPKQTTHYRNLRALMNPVIMAVMTAQKTAVKRMMEMITKRMKVEMSIQR